MPKIVRLTPLVWVCLALLAARAAGQDYAPPSGDYEQQDAPTDYEAPPNEDYSDGNGDYAEEDALPPLGRSQSG